MRQNLVNFYVAHELHVMVCWSRYHCSAMDTEFGTSRRETQSVDKRNEEVRRAWKSTVNMKMEEVRRVLWVCVVPYVFVVTH